MRNAILLFALQICSLRSFGEPNALQITTNFPAGNVHVDSIRGSTVYLRPDLRDTSQDWFYWYFAVRSPRADSVRFVFTKPSCLTIKGPAVSTDGGKSWRWLYASFAMSDRFAYALPANQEVRFSMGIPYTQVNWDAFINPYRKHPTVRLETLCTTPKGRTTEKLVIRPVGRSALRKVLITARHHVCEMMANYVMEGILATVLSDDSATKALRNQTEFWVIPFVDKDGVEDGDQGKFRAPRDHNRDYDGKSIYCSTSALRQQVPAWSKGQLRIAMDLHCPWIKGPYNEVIYVVGSEKPAIDVAQRKFIEYVIDHNRGPLRYDRQQGMVPYGTAWNTAANTTQGMSFGQWVQTLPGVGLVVPFEIPYSSHNGEAMTPEKLRLFGRDVAFAMAAYLNDQLN